MLSDSQLADIGKVGNVAYLIGTLILFYIYSKE